MGFPGSSDGRESACNVGDLGWIPGRSSGEGNGNPLSILAGKHYGQRSLVGYSPQGHTELDTTVELKKHGYLF